ncbi:MAG: HAD hydrolase family protein [Bacteroidales bacterium]|jgi:3-deoxy-D-manno-octulosonate 8-phosphate phosphatase (KDO 8-P phosphatase)|nr:HAD hydrolase family protein [Bacteroidales bacterium]
MTFVKEKFSDIKAFIFDVDGVLSLDVTPLTAEGDPVRTTNVKDGYAIRNACNMGYHVGIITAGYVERVKLRHAKLGMKHIFMGVSDKMECLRMFMDATGVAAEQILYMGDDMPDYRVMKAVGMSACPADAIHDIQDIALYISPKEGGRGCVRDVIEQVMRIQNTWLNENSYLWRN